MEINFKHLYEAAREQVHKLADSETVLLGAVKQAEAENAKLRAELEALKKRRKKAPESPP